MTLQHCDLIKQPLAALRQAIRSGRYGGQTAGLAPGQLQGNLVILPRQHAFDFLRYCQRNPKPCPLLAVSDPGDPTLPALGEAIDIRHDVPRYHIYRDGELVDSVNDLGALWQNDWVSFILGCSFSFEAALMEAGIRLRHIEQGRNIAMYRSTIATRPCGAFCGGMVVSMRPLTAQDAITAVTVSARFPHAHGAPVHLGDPSLIGINNLSQPDWGDPVTIYDNELPVFWACGVTPQEAIRQAKPELCITHAPGCMLIADLPSNREPSINTA